MEMELNSMSDLTDLKKMLPEQLSLSPIEMLIVREFIALNFPEYIHKIELDDMEYIVAVSSVFQKLTKKLKDLGLNIEEYDE